MDDFLKIEDENENRTSKQNNEKSNLVSEDNSIRPENFLYEEEQETNKENIKEEKEEKVRKKKIK